MATRSRIALQLEDGSIVSVYNHWDGYPAGVGFTLVANYIRDLEKLAASIALGN